MPGFCAAERLESGGRAPLPGTVSGAFLPKSSAGKQHTRAESCRRSMSGTSGRATMMRHLTGSPPVTVPRVCAGSLGPAPRCMQCRTSWCSRGAYRHAECYGGPFSLCGGEAQSDLPAVEHLLEVSKFGPTLKESPRAAPHYRARTWFLMMNGSCQVRAGALAWPPLPNILGRVLVMVSLVEMRVCGVAASRTRIDCIGDLRSRHAAFGPSCVLAEEPFLHHAY